MKYLYVALLCVFLAGCGKTDEPEIYNENNTNVINGIVYDIYEKPINGIYKTYYGNGSIKMEMAAQGGLPEGEGKFYDENGSLQYDATFVDGKLNGKFYHYYEDGNIHNELNYVNGQQSGVQILYDDKGQKAAEVYYENNRAVKGYVFIDGKKIELNESELKRLSLGIQNIAEELPQTEPDEEELKE
jgi:antitoxin component YwqK of YwqJK toxin-antitoxin module